MQRLDIFECTSCVSGHHTYIDHLGLISPGTGENFFCTVWVLIIIIIVIIGIEGYWQSCF